LINGGFKSLDITNLLISIYTSKATSMACLSALGCGSLNILLRTIELELDANVLDKGKVCLPVSEVPGIVVGHVHEVLMLMEYDCLNKNLV
jgi:hypothetical protein